jgi:plastocyanin
MISSNRRGTHISTPPIVPDLNMAKRPTHPSLISLVVACAFIVSACEEGDAPPPSEPTVAAEQAEGALVEIDVDEYVVLMDPVVPAGTVTLKLVNRGFEEHNLLFVVTESDSTVWETEGRLAPAERRTVVLDLEPGTYRAVCDFSGHEGRGMFTDFVVGETTSAER